MEFSNLKNDIVPEIKLDLLRKIQIQEDKLKPLLLLENNDSFETSLEDNSEDNLYYDELKANSYSANCEECSHCNLKYEYCNKKKEVIYDNMLFAFGCKDYNNRVS